jgi:hypothetical protein
MDDLVTNIIDSVVENAFQDMQPRKFSTDIREDEVCAVDQDSLDDFLNVLIFTLESNLIKLDDYVYDLIENLNTPYDYDFL